MYPGVSADKKKKKKNKTKKTGQCDNSNNGKFCDMRATRLSHLLLLGSGVWIQHPS
jgi:hypothetical protein